MGIGVVAVGNGAAVVLAAVGGFDERSYWQYEPFQPVSFMQR